jgi:glycosyltransferase involved in cell wall biosynthesis
MIIAVDRSDYLVARNITSSASARVKIQRRRNAFSYLNYPLYKLFGRIDPLLSNLHWSPPWNGVLHTFNSVSLGSSPWVVTYESLMPYWSPSGHRRGDGTFGLRFMAGSACKRLIAMSQCADRIQRDYLSRHQDYAEDILPKMTVLHPPQPVIANSADKTSTGPIRFIFVGADFFRKGGREMLRAFDAALDKDMPVCLSIVSSMNISDHATEDDRNEAMRIIAKHPGSIELLGAVPNSEVIQKMLASHVALLPTWAETYGFSVLEAQACGCPVITTDIRAMPEINGDYCGWMIKVPQDRLGFAQINTKKERGNFSELLTALLLSIIGDIVEQTETISRKSNAALRRIRDCHDPTSHATQLETIYKEALS